MAAEDDVEQSYPEALPDAEELVGDLTGVLEVPTEEECYLYSILTDESGIDLAEFAIFNPENDDGCFRAWPFQYSWFRDSHPQVIDQCGRAVGKTLSILLRAFAFVFNYPGQEMLITAPELNHLEMVTEKVESYFFDTRLGSELIERRRGSLTHRPFLMKFANGAKIIGRIPQRDGRGVKGQHPLVLAHDESQDYPKAGWKELTHTLKRGVIGAQWRAHGVSRGVQDEFYDRTQDVPGNPWHVHRISQIHRPNWNDEERQQQISEAGGSREDPDYKRNVYGEHGGAVNMLFILHRLMKCVDSEPESDYNDNEYYPIVVKDIDLEERQCDVTDLLDLPAAHTAKYKTFWAGMDVGYCVDDQTEIFTRRGWLCYSEVRVGDESLAINPDTGMSEWQTISDVYQERLRSPMVLMEGQSFSAYTTPHHRWLVRGESGRWRWKTTRTLNTKDRIPLAVPRSDNPTKPVYSDAFVELVAWFWTEGHIQNNVSVSIGQSSKVNPTYVDRIDEALTELYGLEGSVTTGPHIPWARYQKALELLGCGQSVAMVAGAVGASQWAVLRWRDDRTRRSPCLWRREFRRDQTMVYFYLSRPIVNDLLAVAPNKVVSTEFLSKLTQEQLELFIDVSEKGDGWIAEGGHVKIEQHDEQRIRAYEAACALAGMPTSTCYDPVRERWHTAILAASSVGPVASSRLPNVGAGTSMRIGSDVRDGVIWCPTIGHGNWLARRRGSVYFTGNTNDPSEILVFAEYKPNAAERKLDAHFKRAHPIEGATRIKLITRISLIRMSNPQQVRAVCAVVGHYKPRTFALDKTGAGLPLFQDIQDMIENAGSSELAAEARAVAETIKGYNFSEKILVDIDETIDVPVPAAMDAADPTQVAKQAGIERSVLEHATDCLRRLVDEGRIFFPWDRELIKELQGQTFSYSKANMDQYGRRRRLFSEGRFHALDACRMAAMGLVQHSIEEFIGSKKKQKPVLDSFMQP